MIYWHKHHIVPRHAGGTNDPSNLVRVNVAMHAFLHKCLYEHYGRQYDLVAWLGLSRQISGQEALRRAHRLATFGKKNSADVREKKRKAKLGKKHCQSTKDKISQSLKGKITSDSTKDKIRQIRLGRHHTEQSKQKMKANKVRKTYRLISPIGELIDTNNLGQFCKDNNLCWAAMVNVSKGRHKHHRSWSCQSAI